MATTLPAAAPATVAASQSALDTILTTVETATDMLSAEMPVIAEVGGFVPGATPFISIVGMALPYVQNAIKLIMQEEGKDALTAFKDFVLHISKGGPLSPTLALAKNPDGSFGPATAPTVGD
jgi:hypothetical protein